jgi:hypothetical protein
MGGVQLSDNLTHRNNISKAEATRQAATAGTPTQAAVNAAEIAYYRTVLSSAIANNCETSGPLLALRQLGVTGL